MGIYPRNDQTGNVSEDIGHDQEGEQETQIPCLDRGTDDQDRRLDQKGEEMTFGERIEVVRTGLGIEGDRDCRIVSKGVSIGGGFDG